MGKNRPNPSLNPCSEIYLTPGIQHCYDMFGSKGYNALAAFEITLVNLSIIDMEWVADIEDTERFDELFTAKSATSIEVETRFRPNGGSSE